MLLGTVRSNEHATYAREQQQAPNNQDFETPEEKTVTSTQEENTRLEVVDFEATKFRRPKTCHTR